MDRSREPIYCADVVLISPKARGRKERKWIVPDVVIVGNSPEMIWSNPVQRNRFLRKVFTTDSKYKNAVNDDSIRIDSIEFNSFHGVTQDNANWDCTDWNKSLPLLDDSLIKKIKG